MPLFRRFGRPGLIGLAARTAVVAGTATAVTGAIYGHRQRQAAQAAAPDTQPIPTQGVDTTAELQRLAALHSAGDLTDAEFQAAKSRLLA